MQVNILNYGIKLLKKEETPCQNIQ
jgi:hypothetical protein